MQRPGVVFPHFPERYVPGVFLPVVPDGNSEPVTSDAGVGERGLALGDGLPVGPYYGVLGNRAHGCLGCCLFMECKVSDYSAVNKAYPGFFTVFIRVLFRF